MGIAMAKRAVPPTPPTISPMAALESAEFGSTFIVVDVGVKLDLVV